MAKTILLKDLISGIIALSVVPFVMIWWINCNDEGPLLLLPTLINQSVKLIGMSDSFCTTMGMTMVFYEIALISLLVFYICRFALRGLKKQVRN